MKRCSAVRRLLIPREIATTISHRYHYAGRLKRGRVQNATKVSNLDELIDELGSGGGFPVASAVSMARQTCYPMAQTPVYDWLANRVSGFWFVVHGEWAADGDPILFREEDDAVLFRLKFAGSSLLHPPD